MKKALLVLSLALLCAVLAVGLPGCSGEDASTDTGKTGKTTTETQATGEEPATREAAGSDAADRPDPEDTVTAFWAALSSGDVTGALTCCSDTLKTRTLKLLFTTLFSAKGSEYDTDLQEFMEGLGLTPVSSEVNGDKATVKVEVTAPDLEQIDLIFDEMIGLSADMAEAEDYSSLSQEEIIRQFTLDFMTLLNTLPAATAEQDISLVWEDGAWKISSDPFKDLEQYFYVFLGQP